MVTIPGIDGELGILPLHTPLMTQLKPGELRIKRGGQETRSGDRRRVCRGDAGSGFHPHR